MALTLPNDGAAFRRLVSGQGFWLDGIDVVSADGEVALGRSVLILNGKIYGACAADRALDQLAPVSDRPTAPVPQGKELPRFDGGGHFLLPGFINSHSHIAMALFKGLASVSAEPAGTAIGGSDAGLSLVENLFFKVEEFLTPDIMTGLCVPSLLEALHSGTTALVDSYFFSDQVAKAMTQIGLRGFVSEHFADLGGPHQKGLKDWPSYRDKLTAPAKAGSRVGRIVYAHATDTVSEPLLKELASFAAAHKLPFHMHLAQSFGETRRTRTHAGKDPIPFAIDCGAVTERSVLVHLVDCSRVHLDLLLAHRPTIALCPVSEVLYETLPNLPMLMNSGLAIVLGTDCAASNDGFDMTEELRSLALFYKLQSGRMLPAKQALATVWRQPYKLWFAHEPLADGTNADFCLVAKNASLLPIHDMASHIIYSHIGRHIEAVFVGGELLSRHGRYAGEGGAALTRDYERSLTAIERLLWDSFSFRSVGTKLAGFKV